MTREIMTTENPAILIATKLNRYDRTKIYNSTRFRDLIRSLKEHGQNEPVKVDKDMRILDGETRYMALCQLGLPVKYIIEEVEGDEADMIMLEAGLAKKWDAMDATNFWAVKGKIPYMKVMSLVQETGIPISFIGPLSAVANSQPINNNSYEYLRGMQQDFDYDRILMYYAPIRGLVTHKSFGTVKRQIVAAFAYAVNEIGFKKASSLFASITRRASIQSKKISRDTIISKLTSLGSTYKYSLDFPSSLSYK